MKKMIVLNLAILVYSASLLFAQTTAMVQNADLAIPFGTVSGKIVMTGDHLVFIDEERPDQSFVVAKNEVKGISIQDGTASLELRHPVRDRSGERSQLSLRLTNSDTSSLKRWLGPAATTPTTSAPKFSAWNKQLVQPELQARPRLANVPADTLVQLRLNQGLSFAPLKKAILSPPVSPPPW